MLFRTLLLFGCIYNVAALRQKSVLSKSRVSALSSPPAVVVLRSSPTVLLAIRCRHAGPRRLIRCCPPDTVKRPVRRNRTVAVPLRYRYPPVRVRVEYPAATQARRSPCEQALSVTARASQASHADQRDQSAPTPVQQLDLRPVVGVEPPGARPPELLHELFPRQRPCEPSDTAAERVCSIMRQQLSAASPGEGTAWGLREIQAAYRAARAPTSARPQGLFDLV